MSCSLNHLLSIDFKGSGFDRHHAQSSRHGDACINSKVQDPIGIIRLASMGIAVPRLAYRVEVSSSTPLLVPFRKVALWTSRKKFNGKSISLDGWHLSGLAMTSLRFTKEVNALFNVPKRRDGERDVFHRAARAKD